MALGLKILGVDPTPANAGSVKAACMRSAPRMLTPQVAVEKHWHAAVSGWVLTKAAHLQDISPSGLDGDEGRPGRSVLGAVAPSVATGWLAGRAWSARPGRTARAVACAVRPAPEWPGYDGWCPSVSHKLADETVGQR